MPIMPASQGSRSTGSRSMAFISKIQQKMVSARGATKGFLPEKEPRTFSSTKSTTHSAKFCAVPGTPAVTESATLLEEPGE